MPAPLGQMANINLGGYIPAPAQRTPLWQQVLAGFLGNALTQGSGALINKVTAPNILRYNLATGELKPGEEIPWWEQRATAQDLGIIRNAETAARAQTAKALSETERNAIDSFTSKVNARQGARRLAQDADRILIEKGRAESEDYARRAGVEQGWNTQDRLNRELLLKQGVAAAEQKLAREKMDLAYAQFFHAKNADERDAALKELTAWSNIANEGARTDVMRGELSLREKIAPSQIKANLARVRPSETEMLYSMAVRNVADLQPGAPGAKGLSEPARQKALAAAMERLNALKANILNETDDFGTSPQ